MRSVSDAFITWEVLFRYMTNAPTRDLIVIGCSAGGVEALPRVLQQLPASLPASVVIVQHMAPSSTPYLAGILERASQLPVEWAEQGAKLAPGRVYVGPPDVHTLIADDRIQLTGCARENHSRPAIDKLFRSAAASRGSRVVGVLLTGMLDDGVSGLRAIRDAGGVVVVQDPATAAFPELPARAIQALQPERVVALDEIGGVLRSLAGQAVGLTELPREIALEAEIDRRGAVSPNAMHALGPQTSLVCPECRGPMWQLGDEAARRYRCYLGHATTVRELLAASANEVESALWSAVRALNDRATALETLASDSERIGNGQASVVYTQRAEETRTQAELARTFMLDLARSR